MAAALLEVRGLSKSFGGLRAVDQLSFGCAADEVLGIIGPNGAGKTTAINLLSGVLKPSGGSVRFRGKDIAGFATSDLARLGLIRTFQATMVYSTQTVRENCFRGAYLRLRTGALSGLLGMRAARRAHAEVSDHIETTLRWFDLAAYADVLAGSLPYGFQKMLGLAVALMASPCLLMLDEPAAGLSSDETERIRTIIAQIHRQGIAVIVVEHNMKFIRNLCDRIVVMQYGRMIAEGAPSKVLLDPIVVEAYLGQPHAST